jgi:hypothetical protein
VVEREVRAVSVDHRGFVTRLINGDESWSPRSAIDAILDLDLGQASYFIDWPEGRSPILDAEDSAGRFLTAHRDGGDVNDLLGLPRVTPDAA